MRRKKQQKPNYYNFDSIFFHIHFFGIIFDVWGSVGVLIVERHSYGLPDCDTCFCMPIWLHAAGAHYLMEKYHSIHIRLGFFSLSNWNISQKRMERWQNQIIICHSDIPWGERASTHNAIAEVIAEMAVGEKKKDASWSCSLKKVKLNICHCYKLKLELKISPARNATHMPFGAHTMNCILRSFVLSWQLHN